MAAGWIERVWVGCHLLVSFQALCRHLTLPKSLMLGKMGTNDVLDSFNYPAADPSSPGVTYQPFPVCDVLRQNWFQQHIKGNILQASGDWAEGSGYGIACGSCWFLKSTLVRIQLAWKATPLCSHYQSSEKKNKQSMRGWRPQSEGLNPCWPPLQWPVKSYQGSASFTCAHIFISLTPLNWY